MVHGVNRVKLPDSSDFLNVLSEMGIHPDVELFDVENRLAFASREEAIACLRQFLHLKPGSVRDQHLQVVMRQMLIATPEGLALRGSNSGRLALISWVPRSGKSSSLTTGRAESFGPVFAATASVGSATWGTSSPKSKTSVI